MFPTQGVYRSTLMIFNSLPKLSCWKFHCIKLKFVKLGFFQNHFVFTYLFLSQKMRNQIMYAVLLPMARWHSFGNAKFTYVKMLPLPGKEFIGAAWSSLSLVRNPHKRGLLVTGLTNMVVSPISAMMNNDFFCAPSKFLADVIMKKVSFVICLTSHNSPQ